MAWTRGGTISVSNGSAVVNGAGVTWGGNAVMAGYILVTEDGNIYEIQALSGSTQITLSEVYAGPTNGAASYVIIPTKGADVHLHELITEFLEESRNLTDQTANLLTNLQTGFTSWLAARDGDFAALIAGWDAQVDGVLAGWDLSAIDVVLADSAVDCCIYDTSEDSDGGAWRDRCQHLSWYNEPLNTATRGARREFPAVAVIVGEADRVVIYDGDDPSLPMWMVFHGSYSWGAGRMLVVAAHNSAPLTSVSFLQGILCVSSAASGASGLHKIDFIKDGPVEIFANPRRVGRHTDIAHRNELLGAEVSGSSIVHHAVNDVAMSVLPGAPIDPATGLAVPTIAVATDGGISVIRDDGSVVDIASSAFTMNVRNVDFVDGRIVWSLDSNSSDAQRIVQAHDIPDADLVFSSPDYTRGISDERYIWKVGGGWTGDLILPVSSGGVTRLASVSDEGLAISGANGLALVHRNPGQPATSMAALLTSEFNTGWMPGDIKGAWLCDSDDADLVGGVIIDDDFSGGIANISSNNAEISVSSNQLIVDDTGNAGSWSSAVISLSGLTDGEKYTVFLDVVSATGYSHFALHSSLTSNSPNQQIATGLSGVGLHSFDFTYQAGNDFAFIGASGTEVSVFNRIVIAKATPDRSHNGKGLAVHGTITKEPVAPGVEAMAYGGFSASNYLEQPYNPDLDFGTGDFCVMGWVSDPQAWSTIISRSDGAGNGWYIQRSTTGLWMHVSNGADLSGGVMQADGLSFVCVVRRDGELFGYVNGDLQCNVANAGDLSFASAVMQLGGKRSDLPGSVDAFKGRLMGWRVAATAPSADQIRKIYEDEKHLFAENAKCTLYGDSDAVNAIAHDKRTGLLHVGTADGRSDFQGLVRVDHSTDPINNTIAAHGGLIVED